MEPSFAVHFHLPEADDAEVAQALRRLSALRVTNVSVKVFDGGYGWAAQSPYDGIVVSAAAPAVPERLAATAQTVYGALALGLASAALTFASGYLYAGLGMRAFWIMGGLCAAALPFVGGMSEEGRRRDPLQK